jgi:hypothetical protein
MWSNGELSRGVFEILNFVKANKFLSSRATGILLHDFDNCLFRAGCFIESWLRKLLYRCIKTAISFIERIK